MFVSITPLIGYLMTLLWGGGGKADKISLKFPPITHKPDHHHNRHVDKLG